MVLACVHAISVMKFGYINMSTKERTELTRILYTVLGIPVFTDCESKHVIVLARLVGLLLACVRVISVMEFGYMNMSATDRTGLICILCVVIPFCRRRCVKTHDVAGPPCFSTSGVRSCHVYDGIWVHKHVC